MIKTRVSRDARSSEPKICIHSTRINSIRQRVPHRAVQIRIPHREPAGVTADPTHGGMIAPTDSS
jgi:hypothetical protein